MFILFIHAYNHDNIALIEMHISITTIHFYIA